MVQASAQSQKRFYAHDRDGGRHSGHIVSEAEDFHEAAILFAERWAPDDFAEGLAVIVKDCDSGEEQCFTVHLGEHGRDGEAEPC